MVLTSCSEEQPTDKNSELNIASFQLEKSYTMNHYSQEVYCYCR